MPPPAVTCLTSPAVSAGASPCGASSAEGTSAADDGLPRLALGGVGRLRPPTRHRRSAATWAGSAAAAAMVTAVCSPAISGLVQGTLLGYDRLGFVEPPS